MVAKRRFPCRLVKMSCSRSAPVKPRRAAGLHGLDRRCVWHALCESFFHTLQLELLDEHHWTSRRQFAQGIFEWIETWYNQSRRHSSIQMLSPVNYENLKAAAAAV